MRISDFHFDLPEELIAQHPAERRDQSRLLVLYRSCGEVFHKSFTDFPSFIEPGDLIVLNNSKVIPARLRGSKPETGGQIEMLLVEEVRANDWWTMLKPGKRTRAG
ncbi:MAG: S-adenosylmethionine:tRNA ribosyltransferase-isomerase, partial [Yoonia sp.]